jgi:DNA-directed RNA polymerase subunit alpha
MQKNVARELIKPKRVEFEDSTERYGKFIVEPLERGYGTTIGNSLRRIMLSSLQGAAITEVQIEGVKHEFSTIPGCMEDVTEIVLNLKNVVLDLGEKESAALEIDIKGPCEVTAGMIKTDGIVTVLNPLLHIASINEECHLRMTMNAKTGRGYVVSEANKQEDSPVGTIPLDAMFSPVRKVNHIVTNARVGQRTDYDKLTIEVWTDGSISPESAIKSAAYILRDQLHVLVGVDDTPAITADVAPVSVSAATPSEEKPARSNDNLYRRIDEIELSVRSSNCLENANIKFIGELVQRSEAEMLRTKNFGRKSLTEIKEILGEMGLNLGMKIDSFPSREELERMYEQHTAASNN